MNQYMICSKTTVFTKYINIDILRCISNLKKNLYIKIRTLIIYCIQLRY